jgi:LmbE family N-acetylglucosaminyl deacetylase
MNKRRMMVFAPHPDDETWGCGGVIAKRLSEGYEVLIVVITDGRYAFSKMLNIESDPTPEELKNTRKEEVKRAAKILGVPEKDIVFLDFEDGTLEMCEKEAEERFIEILRKNPPTEVYFPYEKDAHPDHRATNRIVRSALKKLGLSTPKYKYSIAQRYSRVGPIIGSLLNLFQNNIIRVDISEFLHLKEIAIREFHSEIAIISNKQKKPLISGIEKYLKNNEAFYIDK